MTFGSKLCTIEQIEQFLLASADVAFTAFGGDLERYAHISRVLNRFDYFHCSRKDRGVLLRYLQHTSGYSRAQVTRLVAQWHNNRLARVPLVKRYRAPAAPFDYLLERTCGRLLSNFATQTLRIFIIRKVQCSIQWKQTRRIVSAVTQAIDSDFSKQGLERTTSWAAICKWKLIALMPLGLERCFSIKKQESEWLSAGCLAGVF